MEYPQEITFTITQDHVDRGVYRDPHNCPGALAFAERLRALGFEFDRAGVYGTADVYERPVSDPDGYQWVTEYDALPAMAWQRAYDRSDPGLHERAGEAPSVPVTFTFTRRYPK